jgi:large subunit ribosomal protein L25
MKSIAISGTSRDVTKRKEAESIRRSGSIPCVLYGGGEQIHFAAPELSFKNLIYTPKSYLVDLNVDGKEYKAVMREIQFHPVTDKVLHIDFLELKEGKEVSIDVPVMLTGSSIGVKEGGKLILKLRNLKVKALAANLPDKIEIPIDNLGIGSSVRVSDIKIDGVEMLDASNNIIVAIKVTREVAVETPGAPAAGAAAPAAGATPAKTAPGAAPAAAKAAPAKK